MTNFELTPSEKASNLWQRLKAHFDDRLAAARVRNDDPELTTFQTATIRGEIKSLKALLRLDVDRPLTGEGDQSPD